MKKKKFFVLDTNAVMHDSKVMTSFKEHNIIIPVVLLEELDRHKKGDEIKNYNAREFIRKLDGFSEKKLFDGGASLGKNLGKIMVILDFPYHPEVAKYFPEIVSSEKKADHSIINTVYCLTHQEENKNKEIILVSKDVNMRMKAKSLGLKAEDYKTDTVVDLNSLYKKAQRVILSESGFSTLYQQGFVETPEKLIENEFVFIGTEDKQSSGLGVHKNGQIIPILKERICAFNIKPKNPEQAFALSALLDPDIKLVVIIGKAGTGKTILSLAAGLHQLHAQGSPYDAILFTRQTMDLNERGIGFLPGDVSAKMLPYMQCMYDNLDVIKSIDKSNETKISKLNSNNKIIIEPLSYIKGRSLVNKYFIIDEAQNLTPKEVKAIITRAGNNTKIVLIGDTSQIDTNLLDERSNGLSVTFEKMKNQYFFSGLYLREGVRSELAEIAGNIL